MVLVCIGVTFEVGESSSGEENSVGVAPTQFREAARSSTDEIM
jgi:hypothetical protein